MRVGAAQRCCQGWPRPVRGHRIAARSVLDSTEHGARLTAGGNYGLALLTIWLRSAEWNSVAVIATQTQPAMEDRQRTVGILVHFHRRTHEVWTQRALRDL